MNSSRRLLIIFAIVIGVLVIATVSLVLLTKENKVTLLPEDTPQGTVQSYLIAIQERNYQKAFGYLSFDSSRKITTYNDWLNSVTIVPQTYNQTTWKATLGKIMENGDSATVEVTIDTFRPGGPFEDTLRSQQIIFQLSKIADKWLINSPTYIYWIY
jgi:hypothetical protein